MVVHAPTLIWSVLSLPDHQTFLIACNISNYFQLPKNLSYIWVFLRPIDGVRYCFRTLYYPINIVEKFDYFRILANILDGFSSKDEQTSFCFLTRQTRFHSQGTSPQRFLVLDYYYSEYVTTSVFFQSINFPFQNCLSDDVEHSSLGLQHVSGLFMVLGFTIAFCVIILFLEHICYHLILPRLPQKTQPSQKASLHFISQVNRSPL